MTIAYQGAPGAFSEEAARRLGRPGAVPVPCPTFEAVFEAVEAGRVAAAAVPVENRIAGPVWAVRSLLGTREVAVEAGDVWVPVVLALIAPPGVAFEAVRVVHSHPVALAQCGAFFRAHPRLAPVEAFDTAGAVAAVVAAGGADAAALASAHAAAVYGGVVLRPAVQDRADNATRFVRLTRRPG